MLDEYGEELFLDLKEYWGLDLIAFLGGEVLSSVPVIIAFIRNLPEGSRYVSIRAADLDTAEKDIELTPREIRITDARAWTLDRRLMAMITNAVNQNTSALGHWQKGKEPQFPVVGPTSWDPKRMKRLEVKEQITNGQWSNWDVLAAMGMASGKGGATDG